MITAALILLGIFVLIFVGAYIYLCLFFSHADDWYNCKECKSKEKCDKYCKDSGKRFCDF